MELYASIAICVQKKCSAKHKELALVHATTYIHVCVINKPKIKGKEAHTIMSYYL